MIQDLAIQVKIQIKMPQNYSITSNKIEDSEEIKSSFIKDDSNDTKINAEIFRNFRDRFKTWDQMQRPWLYNWK